MATRATKVAVVQCPSGNLVLLISPSNQKETLLITVDDSSGTLIYQGIPGHDTFDTEEDALAWCSSRCCCGKPVQSIVRGHAFLGMVVTPLQVLVLVAVEVKRDPLPGGHAMCTVTKSKWIKGSLLGASVDSALSKADEAGLEKLKDFTISGYHFYSETYDLTRPFPSTSSVLEYDYEYCWNQWLASPFEKAGLRNCCVVLLQGLGCSRLFSFEHPETNEQVNVGLALISRKSIANPGTRYNARGLNKAAGAGNEIESEQIFWVSPIKGDGSIEDQWSSHIWRRGTVPVHWRHELTSSVTAPKIVIGSSPYEGVDQFYHDAYMRYNGTPMSFVNLLRCDAESGETNLSEIFQQSLREAKSLLSSKYSIQMELNMCNFDWHRIKKEMGLETTVKCLWDRLSPLIEKADLSEGCLKLGRAGSPIKESQVEPRRKQASVLRYNCADSLDRTNLCCFMVSQQLLLEQCRRSHIGFTSRVKTEPDIDFQSRLSSHWGFLKSPEVDVDAVRSLLEPKLLEWLAEAYVRNGDLFSFLYTNTPALLTGPMRDYTSLPPAVSDTQISVQRRYHNVLSDSERQLQYFAFLGRYLSQLLPSLSSLSHSACCVSSPHAVLLHQLSSSTHPARFEAQVLDSSPNSAAWMFPPELDVADICLHLRAPSIVTEVQLWIKNGIASCEFPASISIWVGRYINEMEQIYGNVDLPQCEDGTRISFPIPSYIPDKLRKGEQLVPSLLPPAQPKRLHALSQIVQIQMMRRRDGTRSIILGRLSVNGIVPSDLHIEDSGTNKEAERAVSISLASFPTTDSMVEKKFAEGASKTARELGGKALAKADELVDKYAGDDSKLGSIAKGALSSMGKLAGWMGSKAKVSQNKPTNSQTAVTVGNERREKEREIKSSQDVASQLTAMWSNQASGRAWSNPRSDQEGNEVVQRKAENTASASSGRLDLKGMEEAIMAESKGLRASREEQGQSDCSASAAAAAAAAASNVDPLAGVFIGGSNFGQEEEDGEGGEDGEQSGEVPPTQQVQEGARALGDSTGLEAANRAMRTRRNHCRSILQSSRSSLQGCIASFASLAERISKEEEHGKQKEEGEIAREREQIVDHFLRSALSFAAMQLVDEGYETRSSVEEGKGRCLLSQFPRASILQSVPTSCASLPIESVLMPDSLLPFSCGGWKCDEGTERASFTIVLPQLAKVTEIQLLVCGSSEEEGMRREEAPRISMTLQNSISERSREMWEWNLADSFEGEAATPGTLLSFLPPPPPPGQDETYGKFLFCSLQVPAGQQLKLGRLLVYGEWKKEVFHPPSSLLGSPECVAQTSLSSLLLSRSGFAALKAVRAVLREQGAPAGFGGVILDFVVEQGTSITGFGLELKSGLPASPLPADVHLVVHGGAGGNVGGRDAKDAKLDVRIPLTAPGSKLFYSLPAPAVAGQVTLALGRCYDGTWSSRAMLHNLRILLYGFKGQE